MKGQGKELEEPTPVMKSQINKFTKRKGNFQQSSNGSSQGLDQLYMSEKDINVSHNSITFYNDTISIPYISYYVTVMFSSGGTGENVVHN